MASCCLCNGSRSWCNGLKYCFLHCIRLHRITGCSFFHPQRLGGILFSFYTFVDWFSSCTHSSSLLSDVVAFFLWCYHSFFFFFVYGCVILLWPPFSLHCIGHYCFHSAVQPSSIHTTLFIGAYIGFSNRFPFIASEIVVLISCDNHAHLNPLINFT